MAFGRGIGLSENYLVFLSGGLAVEMADMYAKGADCCSFKLDLT